MVSATPTRRFRPRFRLRTFLVVVTIFCVWLGWHIHGARRQREAVEAIRNYGGLVYYDYQHDQGRPRFLPESPVPVRVLGLFGEDFFHSVEKITFLSDSSERTTQDTNYPPIAAIAKLPRLQFLFLGDYDIDDDDLRPLGRLTRLQLLAVEKATGVTDDGVVHLSSLRELEYLYIHNAEFIDPELKCQLGDRSLEVISRMPELRTLNVWGTFTDRGVSHLRRLKNLRSLILGHGRRHKHEITDDSLAFLLELPGLDTLQLNDTKVTREFVERVKATFPQAKVSW